MHILFILLLFFLLLLLAAVIGVVRHVCYRQNAMPTSTEGNARSSQESDQPSDKKEP